MHSMTAGDCDQCRHCAQWTHGSIWRGRAQTGMGMGTEMGIWGIMVIAMASIMERMVHRMVRKCNSVDSANSKTESTARASASDGEDKNKGDCR